MSEEATAKETAASAPERDAIAAQIGHAETYEFLSERPLPV